MGCNIYSETNLKEDQEIIDDEKIEEVAVTNDKTEDKGV